MSRASKKQRIRMRQQRRAERERRMKAGPIRVEQIETPAQRKARLVGERAAQRLADRRAEHHIPDGRLWGMVDGRTRRTAALCRELREAGVPHFRAADQVERVLPDGRRRTLKVPLCARAVIVGVRDDRGKTPAGPDRLTGTDYHAMRRLSRDVAAVHLQPGDERPRTVPAAEVTRFAEMLIGQRLLTREDTAPIEAGERVRVLSGPFASFGAVVEEITEAGRLRAAVSLFGRPTPVELEPTQVERA